MSICRSTRSGITLILVPPWAMVGANVVCVQAWNCRAIPTGSASHASMNRSGSRSGPTSSSGYSIPSRNCRQTSWISVAGSYSARRCTTFAAVTRALSVL